LPFQAKALLGFAIEQDWLRWWCDKYDNFYTNSGFD